MSRRAILVGRLGSFMHHGDTTVVTGAEPAWVLVRGDLTAVPDILWLRTRFAGTTVFSQGNPQPDSPVDALTRRSAFLHAAGSYDLIDLDADADLAPEILRSIPWEKRMVSWEGSAASPDALRQVFERISSTHARYYKLVTNSQGAEAAIASLAFLARLGRDDTFGWASGESGMWTRFLAPRFGAPVIYGHMAAPDEHLDLGEPSVAQLIRDYGFPDMPDVNEIYGIAGARVLRSLSPRLHNTTYATLGRHAIFLPFQSTCLATFQKHIADSPFLADAGMQIKGLTLASPHKESAVSLAKSQAPVARRAQSSNIHVRNHDGWIADTTDPDGVIPNLRERGFQFENVAVAVVGCGGSGRAIAAALSDEGANVTLVNRSISRGHYASWLLGLPFVTLADFDSRGYGVVINATPVGGTDGAMAFSPANLSPDAIVVDQVYRDGETPLIEAARKRGHRTVSGREVLVAQVRRQFELMTGEILPLNAARETVGLPPLHMTAEAH